MYTQEETRSDVTRDDITPGDVKRDRCWVKLIWTLSNAIDCQWEQRILSIFNPSYSLYHWHWTQELLLQLSGRIFNSRLCCCWATGSSFIWNLLTRELYSADISCSSSSLYTCKKTHASSCVFVCIALVVIHSSSLEGSVHLLLLTYIAVTRQHYNIITATLWCKN